VRWFDNNIFLEDLDLNDNKQERMSKGNDDDGNDDDGAFEASGPQMVGKE
jgi:hypothetical protein